MNKSKAMHSAFDTAIYYITYKDRSKKELCNKLLEKGYSDSEIDEAMDKLSYYGYINDERYALSYIKGNINKKGINLIKRELTDKGIDNSVIADQMDELQCDEEEIISRIIEQRYSGIDYTDERQLRRVYGYFARRGFKYENISKTVAKYRKNY